MTKEKIGGYEFEKFTNVGAKTSNYTISLNASQGFSLNSGFYRKEGINKYERVFLFWDDQRKAVAFLFVNSDEKGSFKIAHAPSKTTGSVTARSFVMANKIDKKEYRGQREVRKIEDNGKTFYIIELIENDNKDE